MGKGPLTGARILDLTQFESGTVCTETLAWLGAEVLKVERPGQGELGRYAGYDPDHDSFGFILLNMNKKGLTCNMKKPEGLELIKKLLVECDVIVENMGPGAMGRLGLSYEDCKAVNDKIIYASIKGFYSDGPYAKYPAFDPIATHTGGMVAATGLPDQPIKAGISVADEGAGVMCALSIIAALLQREKEGIGQAIEVDMQDVIMGFSRAGWEPYYNTGASPRRVGNGMPLEDVQPSDTYPCKPFGPNDYVHIYCSRRPGSPDWPAFCKAIGHEELLEDERMATPHSRFENREVLDKAVCEWTAQHTKQEAMAILAEAGVPAGALLDIHDFATDPQYIESGMVVEVDHVERGKLKFPGFACRMSANEIEYKSSPALGGNNDEIYGGLLGLSEAEMADLKEKKVI